jgi:hypothetical protein
MAARKWLLAAAAAATLAGCATYDDPDTYYDRVAYREYPTYYGYRDYPYDPYYGPRYHYYSPPVVSFGLAYNRGYYRHPGG